MIRLRASSEIRKNEGQHGYSIKPELVGAMKSERWH
jgi:hypothetical protein